MKILWVGPITTSSSVGKYRGISPAANKWQLSLINALLRNGAKVSCLSYLPDSCWPKGHFLPVFDQEDLEIGVPTVGVRYLNVLFLREVSLLYFFKLFVNPDSFDFIVTYNPLPRHRRMGEFARKSWSKKWVSIVADGKPVGMPDFEVLLSRWAFQQSVIRCKMHLDGGMRSDLSNIKILSARNRVILYAGSLNKWTGILRFARHFDALNPKGFELHIYGRNPCDELLNVVKRSGRIHIKGFVSEKDYHTACLDCYAFVNPRPENIEDGQFNFPSKILDYIPYGKPIVSTKVPGMSEKYDDLLLIYNSSDIDSLQMAFNRLLSLSQSDVDSLSKKLVDFAKNNTWENRAKEFMEFLATSNK